MSDCKYYKRQEDLNDWFPYWMFLVSLVYIGFIVFLVFLFKNMNTSPLITERNLSAFISDDRVIRMCKWAMMFVAILIYPIIIIKVMDYKPLTPSDIKYEIDSLIFYRDLNIHRNIISQYNNGLAYYQKLIESGIVFRRGNVRVVEKNITKTLSTCLTEEELNAINKNAVTNYCCEEIKLMFKKGKNGNNIS
ncbi:Uncharacterised protein [Klebsiella quasipneumoniae]|uniref:hypothetical protein n=1 Tax=Klebsiella quasipneumoniae TaxID=1463165 RepID=UPI000A0EFED6|nr:hypothetical protein [Klebsiella quasipneumoniae]SMG72961.1 Uncharacterised protein [Klebsiella quasipneumoniae]